jgi:hypothetical protein
MEDMTAYSPEVYKTLKRLFSYYILSGILFVLIISGGIVAKKYADSLYETTDKLQEFNIQYIKIIDAMVDIDKSIKIIKTLLPPDFDMNLPEEFILIALDDLKTRMGDANITISNIEDKGNEVQLPVTIKSPLRDHTAMVNHIGYLQSLKFPFFAINGVKISKSSDKANVQATFEITGALKYPRIGSQTPGAVGKKAGGRI